MRILHAFAGACLLLIILYPARVLAQTQYASLFGVVQDAATGETIPFANVIVQTKEGKMITGAAADLDGLFELTEIPMGTFDVEVSFIGYNAEVVKDFVFEAGLNLLDFMLKQAEGCNVYAESVVYSCCICYCVIPQDAEYIEDVFDDLEQEYFEAFKVENQDLLDDGYFVYPNPANDLLHASFDADIKSLELVDMNGCILYQTSVSAFEEHTMQVANYPAGLYQLRYFKEGKWESQKIVITR